jgi:hypothetical protein
MTTRNDELIGGHSRNKKPTRNSANEQCKWIVNKKELETRMNGTVKNNLEPHKKAKFFAKY